MKSILRITVLLVVALVANYSIVSAKILRVNNNAGVTGAGVYATLPLAYAATLSGDTLIIEGSTTTYGDLTITRKLTIFGPGYLLAENPETQASSLTASLNDITFNAGADNSLISGCKINSVTIGDSSITIARNFIQNSTAATPSINITQNATNIMIKQNIVWGKITSASGKIISVVIQNNLLGYIDFGNTVTARIDHNTFNPESCPNAVNGISVHTSQIYNNVIGYYYYNYANYSGQVVFDAAQNNTIAYNVFAQAAPTIIDPQWATGNQYSIVMSTVYTSFTGAIDKKYVVLSGSAADGKDESSKECGMFGGSTPYILSGLPPIPHIYMLNADPAGTNTDPLSVKISVKSQN